MSLTGECKSFSGKNGFGFIVGEDGSDVFVHLRECVDGMVPQKRDMLSYDLGESKHHPGQQVAINVTGGSCKKTENGAVIIMNGTGANEATVKSFDGWRGYIEWEGEEGGLFFHAKACKGSYPKAGDTVKFDVEAATDDQVQVIKGDIKAGQMQAVNITGGSQPLGIHKGKGKGKDKGPYDWGYMNMMMQMMSWGKAKGKGKGKW